MLSFALVALCLVQLVLCQNTDPTIEELFRSVKDEELKVKVSAPAGTFVGRTVKVASGLPLNVFLGVPYAEPPVGPLRFQKTAPVGKLLEEYDASEHKSFCVQTMNVEFGYGEEDCLYLNIYTPGQTEEGSLKKVFVFIHGGGNMNGMKDFYHPGTLVTGTDIIVVSVNYRLGLLGFLSTKTDSAPGNSALWDQLEALRWIRANIRAFGGDPEAVTVSGESAGGYDVTALSVTSHSRGLFARVFAMSGSIGPERPVISENPGALTLSLARRENCSTEDAKEPESSEEWAVLVDCLRQVPALRFSALDDLGAAFPGPVIDGDFFPKTLKELMSDSAYLDSFGFYSRDYLLSVCYNEGGMFVAMQEQAMANMTQEEIDAMPKNAMLEGFIGQFISYMFGSLSPEVIKKVAEYYAENFEIGPAADFAADAIFHVPSIDFMNNAVRGWKGSENKVRFFRFVNFPEFLTGPYKGTLHGIDLVYLFDLNPKWINKVVDIKADGSKWTSDDVKLREKYTSFISSFVKSGSPALDWPAYTEQDGHYVEFTPTTPRLQQHLKAERVKLFLQQIPAWMEEFPYTEPQDTQGGQTKRAGDEL